MPNLGRSFILPSLVAVFLPLPAAARALSSLFDGESDRYVHAAGFGPFPEDHEPAFDKSSSQFKSGTSYFKRADGRPGVVAASAVGAILAFVAVLVALWFLVHHLMRRRAKSSASIRPVLKVQISVDSRHDSDVVSPWTATDKPRTPLAAFLRSPFNPRRGSQAYASRVPPSSLAAAVEVEPADLKSDWPGPLSDRTRRNSSGSMTKGIHLDLDLAEPFQYATGIDGESPKDPFASPPPTPPAPKGRPTLTVPMPIKRASLVADELSPAYSMTSIYSPVATELSQARRITLSAQAASSLVNVPEPHTFPPEPQHSLSRAASKDSRRASRSLARDVAQRNMMLARARDGEVHEPAPSFHVAGVAGAAAAASDPSISA